MPKNLNIVIAGLGTVGSSTINLIEKNNKIFLLKSGLKINIVGISGKNQKKKRTFNKNKYKWFKNPLSMVQEKI